MATQPSLTIPDIPPACVGPLSLEETAHLIALCPEVRNLLDKKQAKNAAPEARKENEKERIADGVHSSRLSTLGNRTRFSSLILVPPCVRVLGDTVLVELPKWYVRWRDDRREKATRAEARRELERKEGKGGSKKLADLLSKMRKPNVSKLQLVIGLNSFKLTYMLRCWQAAMRLLVNTWIFAGIVIVAVLQELPLPAFAASVLMYPPDKKGADANGTHLPDILGSPGFLWLVGLASVSLLLAFIEENKARHLGLIRYCRSIGLPRIEEFMLSYNWGVADDVRTIARALADSGVGVWLDVLKLTTGDNIRGTVSGVASDVRFVVIFLTEAYMKSPNCVIEIFSAIEADPGKIILHVAESTPMTLELVELLSSQVMKVTYDYNGLFAHINYILARCDTSDFDWWKERVTTAAGIPAGVVPSKRIPKCNFRTVFAEYPKLKSVQTGPIWIDGNMMRAGSRASAFPWLFVAFLVCSFIPAVDLIRIEKWAFSNGLSQIVCVGKCDVNGTEWFTNSFSLSSREADRVIGTDGTEADFSVDIVPSQYAYPCYPGLPRANGDPCVPVFDIDILLAHVIYDVWSGSYHTSVPIVGDSDNTTLALSYEFPGVSAHVPDNDTLALDTWDKLYQPNITLRLSDQIL
ncbi:hypothetical protein BDK51DRAFT_49172 [Blyttiomyces helicus]|uniref:TIR domain-containing protein n=1 Tax=Blyttiomyces helicus TaxID=388810 RepID=A0A4V1IR44_9FUNG|nr:hypothetical protein BDK51DRAFT_49172 [Blyttiomyces helicus]|eukprot:RKO88767.1 hypothetical protein BDK51DRAFT_49172 [Blyttiomyces helicus]